MYIMVVEDDSLTADALEAFLKLQGHTAYFVGNGLAALTNLDAPALALPDIITTDLSMPGMDGEELLGRLSQHEKWRNIPVIVITGIRGGRLEQLHQRYPQARILQKPFEVEELVSVIDGARQEHYRPPDDKGLAKYGAG